MAHFDHQHATSDEPHDELTAARNRHIGLILFLVYAVVYSGFVLLSAFKPTVTEKVIWGGLNVAVVYGLILILAAFVLAMVYGWLCRQPAGGKAEEGRGS